jgi:signal transduction histidine kinase
MLAAGLGQAHIGPYGRIAWLLLLLSSIYSVALYALVRYTGDMQPRRLWHWVDTAWCAGVAVLTGGGGSAFAALSVFPILSASLRWGRAEGMRVSTAIVALWAGAELFHVAGRGDWNAWGWMLTKALLLLAVAYAASQFIEFERHRRARLRLLADINQVPNARFGPDRVIGSALERLRDFYKADTCLAVISTTDSAPRILVAEEGRHGASLEGPKASALVENLLALPDSCGVACSAPRRVNLARAGVYVEGTEGTEQTEEVQKRSKELSQFLDAGSWLTVPLEQRGATVGRLYLMSRKERFGPSDIPFLRHVVDQLMPVVETVRLLDSLASEAAGKERRRISLDLHDSTIQPYLGLKLGLESLSRKADPGNPLAAELEELCRVTNESIAELRRYVRDLKVRPPGSSGSLLEAAQHQANRFSGLYGMDVELNVSPPDLRLNDRLTAEVMQIVGESLSNIGRHTDSRRATINLSRRGQRFLAQVINYGGDQDTPWQSFRPESITQRATQLGGIAEVSGQADGGTAVTVEIPL